MRGRRQWSFSIPHTNTFGANDPSKSIKVNAPFIVYLTKQCHFIQLEHLSDVGENV